MAEIDLIPREHRNKKRLKKISRYFFIFFLLLLAAIGTAKEKLNSLIKSETEMTKLLAAEKTFSLEQNQHLGKLKSQYENLSRQTQALRELRGGPTADSVFILLDKALNDQIWFHDLQFLRAGFTFSKPGQTNSGNYFIVAPKETAKTESWKNSQRVEIHGRALNHAALADFVMGLDRQQEVENVHILQTKSVFFMSKQIIEYHVVAVLN